MAERVELVLDTDASLDLSDAVLIRATSKTGILPPGNVSKTLDFKNFATAHRPLQVL